MKSLTRLTILVVVLAVLTLATGVAYAGQLEVGQLADIFSSEKNRSPESQGLLDRILNNTQDEEDDDEIEIIGTVMSISDTTLMVDETEIALTAETIFEDEVAVGDVVKVEAYYADGGILTAMKVELYEDDDDEEVEIIGTLMSISDTSLVVDETEIALTADTVFEDEVAVGDMVKVEAYYDDGGILTAMKVELYEDDDDEEVEIIGTVMSISDTTLVVDETEIALTADTVFEDEVAVGDMVKVEAYYDEDGILTAMKVELYEDDDDEEVEIIGTLMSISDTSLVVDETEIALTADTVFEDEVAVGDMVKVEAYYDEDGILTAMKVELYEDDDEDEYFKITGTVTSLTAEVLVVDETEIALTADTIFKDEIAVGDLVKVVVYYAEDGTLTAHKVELYEENGNGNGFGYSIKVKLVGEVESYDEDSIVVSGITIAITETTKIKGDIMVGDIVRVHAFMAEDGSLTAWKIKLLPDAVANPGNADKLMVIGGVVESLSSDSIVVSGITFAITSDTRIKGTVEVGDFVTVKAFYDEDGSVIAKQIIQVRGCWDGDTFVRGDDSKCVHGEERGGSDVENPASEKQDVSNTKSVDKLKGYEKDKVKENKDK